MTPRVIGYSLILVMLVSLLSFLILTRSDIEATILRVPGMLYQETEDGRISNLYNGQFVNKTFEEVIIEIRLKGLPEGEIEKIGGQYIIIPANQKVEAVFFVKLPTDKLQGLKTEIIIELIQGDLVIDDVNTNFLGPMN